MWRRRPRRRKNENKMASKSSPPPPPLTLEEFSGLLAAHRQWLDSGGQEGQKAEFAGANLQGLDLSGYNLSHLDFREANLVRVKFGEAHVEGASFRSADLQEADLREVQGLLAPQLAGADLAGARLPESFKDFAALKHVDTASDDVQKLFLILLLVYVYCWLTIAVTTDANLLNNFAEQPLPIIGTKINLVMFYWAAPFLLLCVYLYFHLCLQRLWEALAELPAVFPDGLPLPHRIHPWLWNGLVWAYFPRLRDRRPPLLGLQKLLAILLVWWAGPLTLLCLWFRYLPAHDWIIAILQLVFLTLALEGALGFFLLTRATLGLKARKPFRWKRLWRTAKGVALLLTTAAIFGLFMFLSIAAFWGLGDRLSVVADIREADVSLKPPQWKPGDLDMVRGADLREVDLRGALADKAFLAKADLRYADLQQASLSGANLQQANLAGANLQQAVLAAGAKLPSPKRRRVSYKAFIAILEWQEKMQQAGLIGANLQQSNLAGANLQQADLRVANLQQADLIKANLRQANLSGADFQRAQGLEKNQVLQAYGWQLAKYSPEMLKILQLPPEHNKRLDKKDLSGYQLPGSDLRRAHFWEFNLRGANLRGANLEWAVMTFSDLTGADLRGANLTGARLFETNLRGADLREAKGLTREQLKSVIMDGHTQLPEDLKDLVPSGSKNK